MSNFSPEHFLWVPPDPHSRQRITSNQLKQRRRVLHRFSFTAASGLLNSQYFSAALQWTLSHVTSTSKWNLYLGCDGRERNVVPGLSGVCASVVAEAGESVTACIHLQQLWIRICLQLPWGISAEKNMWRIRKHSDNLTSVSVYPQSPCLLWSFLLLAPLMMLPLWDVYSHPEHLLLEVLLVVTQSASEEEEAGAVGLTLTHKHTKWSTRHNLTHLKTHKKINARAVNHLCNPVHPNHKIPKNPE